MQRVADFNCANICGCDQPGFDYFPINGSRANYQNNNAIHTILALAYNAPSLAGGAPAGLLLCPEGYSMSMDYAVRQIDDVTVLDLSGRISEGVTIAARPRRVLQDLVREQVNAGHTKILLNLRELTYIDSSGLGDLLSSLKIVRSEGGQMRICNTNQLIGELLRKTHLDSVLAIDTDEASALRAFSRDVQKKTSA
jgi:anti-sigma B factor antagonist